jgi:hypothetical protein
LRLALAVLLAAVLPGRAAGAARAPRASAPPPRVLNVTRVRLKSPGSSGYAAVEAKVVRAFERARVPVYWIGLQGLRDQNDILYLNLFDSPDDLGRAGETYRVAATRHPDLTEVQRRLAPFAASQSAALTTRRDDIDRGRPDVDFATARFLRLTTFQVQPGREGEFVEAVRTAHPKDGSWLVYEATDSSTFLLVTLARTPFTRRDGPPVPRTLRRPSGIYIAVETRTYAVRPAMSHAPPAFAAANPRLWRARRRLR